MPDAFPGAPKTDGNFRVAMGPCGTAATTFVAGAAGDLVVSVGGGGGVEAERRPLMPSLVGRALRSFAATATATERLLGSCPPLPKGDKGAPVADRGKHLKLEAAPAPGPAGVAPEDGGWAPRGVAFAERLGLLPPEATGGRLASRAEGDAGG